MSQPAYVGCLILRGDSCSSMLTSPVVSGTLTWLQRCLELALLTESQPGISVMYMEMLLGTHDVQMSVRLRLSRILMTKENVSLL